MGDIVSLSKFRKARTRAAEKQRAAGNRARHGRGKAEKHSDDDTRARREADIESRRLESGEEAEPSD